MDVNNGAEDMISALPDSILSIIVSFLPGTEAMKTSVLSHRWKSVWKLTSNLNFNQSQMLKSLIEDHLSKTNLSTRLTEANKRRHKIYFSIPNDMDPILRSEKLIDSMLDSHSCNLERCSIRHMTESLVSGKTVKWIKKLVKEKMVKEIFMERDGPHDLKYERHLRHSLRVRAKTLDLPFHLLSNIESLELKNYYLKTSPCSGVSHQVLKTLTLNTVQVKTNVWEGILSYCSCLENLTLQKCDNIHCVKIESSSLKFFKICHMTVSEINVSATNLKVFEIDTVICNPQNITFDTPNIQILHSCYNMKIGGQYIPSWSENKHMTSKVILDICSNIQTAQGSPSNFAGIFDNLVNLCVDLDMKRVMNAIALFSALKSFPNLVNLEINSEAMDAISDEGQNEEDILPYPKLMFWQRREFCKCIDHKLKTLFIKGFKGDDFETQFLKYIITTGENIKKIIVCLDDNCSWADAVNTGCVLSYQNASKDLSIVLKPGPTYMSKVGGNFDMWLLYLSEQ